MLGARSSCATLNPQSTSATTTFRPDALAHAPFTRQRKTYHWFSNPVAGLTTTVVLLPVSGSVRGFPAGRASSAVAASGTSTLARSNTAAIRGGGANAILGGNAIGTGTAFSTSARSLSSRAMACTSAPAGNRSVTKCAR